jgi:hypothetical protein
MKTKQTKIDRSGAKWLPGAMAIAATTATTATTASSQAATVQITLVGNKISSTGGDQLNADLTGDLEADLTLEKNVVSYNVSVRADELGTGFWVNAGGDGVGDVDFGFGADGAFNLLKLNTVVFSDDRINAGAPTQAWLEVNAFNSSFSSHTVQLTRLIFDDASVTRPEFSSIPGTQTEWSPTVIPEPSSFALLGLGAAGVLARRRRQAA